MSKPAQPNAVLVAIRTPRVTAEDVDSSLQELTRLVKTVGYNVVGRVTQKRSSDRYAAVLGEGKLAELALWTGGSGKIESAFGRPKDKAAAKDEAGDLDVTEESDDDESEVTEVNEMLAGMERYAGVFVCTTNLFEDLDEAALRRFTFKIGFRALTPEQHVRMFRTEALADAGDPDAQHVQRLGALDLLTPGDFAAVRRQTELLGDAFTPDEFLAQLEGEHRVKPEVRQRRAIGFGPH